MTTRSKLLTYPKVSTALLSNLIANSEPQGTHRTDCLHLFARRLRQLRIRFIQVERPQDKSSSLVRQHELTGLGLRLPILGLARRGERWVVELAGSCCRTEDEDLSCDRSTWMKAECAAVKHALQRDTSSPFSACFEGLSLT